MNENHQQEMVHYLDGGYSYPVTDCFGHFFDGVSSVAAPLPYSNMAQMQEQESAYWSMHMNSFRYGPSSTADMYCGVYVGSGPAPVMDFNLRAWDYALSATSEEPVAVDLPTEEENIATAVHSIPEDRSLNDQDAETSQVDDTHILLQDDFDPDNMTYEELLDLGEALGTESRGLSEELINLLPTSKHKSGGIFSRRKSGDRCVICQMRYKRGDRLINLPCKHAYHTDCGSKWLRINKTCPVCNTEVLVDESRQ